MRIMSLDVGRKRIGIALSDETEMIASPKTTLERVGTRKDIEKLLALAKEENVGKLLVGMPYSLDGGSGPQAEFVGRFVGELRNATEIPVETWDERLSTAHAEDTLREKGLSPKKRRGVVDQVAAAWILQWYLDEKHREHGSQPTRSGANDHPRSRS